MAALVLPGAAGSLAAQAEASALLIAPLAGQRIPVLPLTYLSAGAPIDEMLPAGRVAQLVWADSLLGEMLMARGPEVTWILAPDLRRVARRAPATVTDPDRMGQAMMRSSNLDRVPDPLRSYLRALSAMTDSRLVLIPAAIRLSQDSTGAVTAHGMLVLADTRNGEVVWRSEPMGTGADPARAIENIIAHILPDYN